MYRLRSLPRTIKTSVVDGAFGPVQEAKGGCRGEWPRVHTEPFDDTRRQDRNRRLGRCRGLKILSYSRLFSSWPHSRNLSVTLRGTCLTAESPSQPTQHQRLESLMQICLASTRLSSPGKSRVGKAAFTIQPAIFAGVPSIMKIFPQTNFSEWTLAEPIAVELGCTWSTGYFFFFWGGGGFFSPSSLPLQRKKRQARDSLVHLCLNCQLLGRIHPKICSVSSLSRSGEVYSHILREMKLMPRGDHQRNPKHIMLISQVKSS